MNWLTKQYHFRFSMRTLLVAFFVIALCTSAYMVGHELGTKEGSKLGYAKGVQAADESLKTQIKQANDTLNQSTFLLQDAERQIEVLKIEAKRKQIPAVQQ